MRHCGSTKVWLTEFKFETKITSRHCTKKKFFIKDFFNKCDQIRSYCILHIRSYWSHLLKKCLMKNFIFCAVCFGVFVRNYFFCHYRSYKVRFYYTFGFWHVKVKCIVSKYLVSNSNKIIIHNYLPLFKKVFI